MASVLGLLEERELAARERLEVVRAEADRVLAELAHAERDWEDWITARQRVLAVLSTAPTEPEASGAAAALAPAVPVPAADGAAAVVTAPVGASEKVAAEAGTREPRAGSLVAVWGPGVEPEVLAVEYRRILTVLAERQDTGDDGLMSCQEIASELGLELTPAKVEGVVRSRAKRLVARGWLAEPVAGRFRLAVGPAAAS